MLVKDLPSDAQLINVLIELPDHILSLYRAYGGGEKQMYIVGAMMGDFFLSPNKKEKDKSRRLYPMPLSVRPSDILEWVVVHPEYYTD